MSNMLRYYDSYDFNDEDADYDRYGSGGFQKIRKNKWHEQEKSKPKPVFKRRTIKSWANDDEVPEFEPTPLADLEQELRDAPPPHAVPSTKSAATTTAFTPGPNSHSIRGIDIDFDRVDNMEKIESEHNGRSTYGIKFFFSGKKGLSRVIWFNQNIRERDSVYNSEYAYWHQLHQQ